MIETIETAGWVAIVIGLFATGAVAGTMAGLLGVGGGIVGMLPGVGGLAVFSPRLDAHGHSVRGVRVFEELSQEFSMHVFDSGRPWSRLA